MMTPDPYTTDMMHAAADARYWAATELQRPSTIHRPRLFIDGNQWCALYGENIQDGVAGFGDSPEDAMKAFDEAWTTPLAASA